MDGVFTFIISLIAIVSILIIFFVYMLFRNDAVCKYRTKRIREDYEKYQELPSYDFMLWHFWVLDLSKFEKIPKN